MTNEKPNNISSLARALETARQFQDAQDAVNRAIEKRNRPFDILAWHRQHSAERHAAFFADLMARYGEPEETTGRPWMVGGMGFDKAVQAAAEAETERRTREALERPLTAEEARTDDLVADLGRHTKEQEARQRLQEATERPGWDRLTVIDSQAAQDVLEDPIPWDTDVSPLTREQVTRMMAVEAAANIICPSVDGGRLTMPEGRYPQDVTELAQFILTGEHPSEVTGRMPTPPWAEDGEDD